MLKEMMGYCRYCGQGMIVEIPEDGDQEMADREAMMQCRCQQARDIREKMQAFEICEDNINGLLANWPEVASFLNEAKFLVYGHTKAQKVQITLPGGDGVAILSYGNKGLKVEHKKTLHTELSTGF